MFIHIGRVIVHVEKKEEGRKSGIRWDQWIRGDMIGRGGMKDGEEDKGQDQVLVLLIWTLSLSEIQYLSPVKCYNSGKRCYLYARAFTTVNQDLSGNHIHTSYQEKLSKNTTK